MGTSGLVVDLDESWSDVVRQFEFGILLSMTKRPPERRFKIETRAVERGDWPRIEQLFGANGACGGCWCMWWRVPMGGASWERSKGEPNRRALRELVERGAIHAVLAFDGEQPLGWCCLGPRADFPRAERVKALRGAWDAGTWSVVCFYIPARARGRGVATALLAAAVELARERGARVLEAYPVRSLSDSAADIPAAFAWTGVVTMFARAGFERASASGAREVWKLALGRGRAPGARRGSRRDSGEALRNLGPVSRRWLAEVGIETRAALERAGSLGAYRKVRESGVRVSLNLLYALEGALLDVHWTKLPPDLKRRLATAARSSPTPRR